MPATMAQINTALVDPQFTQGEKFIIKAQYNLLMGSFERALFNIIKVADLDNLRKLGRGFPDEINAWLAWTQGDLGDRIRASGLDI